MFISPTYHNFPPSSLHTQVEVKHDMTARSMRTHDGISGIDIVQAKAKHDVSMALTRAQDKLRSMIGQIELPHNFWTSLSSGLDKLGLEADTGCWSQLWYEHIDLGRPLTLREIRERWINEMKADWEE